VNGNVSRRALVVGIDHYDNFSGLRCSVRDAQRMESVLSRNDNGSVNYTVRTVVTGGSQRVTRGLLRQLWIDLFDGFGGDILFYFSGHGAQTPWGGYLVTQDATRDDLGVSMEDLLLLANRSRARDVVLILDCCHSGDLGNPPILQGLLEPVSLLREGVTILAASRPNEVAFEVDGHGVFTDAIADGLEGGAADHLGNVSAASLFVYADRLFDAWDQRPIYKSHTATVSALRCCRPPVDPVVLRSIRSYFDTANARLRLDPEHESAPDPTEDNPDRAKKREDGRTFKRLRDARLLESVDGEDLYWTAMNSKELHLTNLGRYYWRLLDRKKI
jgi:hypothetical protein